MLATSQNPIAFNKEFGLPLFTALFSGSDHSGILVAAMDSQTARAWAEQYRAELGLSGQVKPYQS